MELRVAAALKQPGESFSASMEQALAPEHYGGREVRFSQPVCLQFTYSFDGKAFTLNGRMRFAVASECARCTKAFDETLDIPFTERFVKGSAASEDDSYTFDGETLELLQMVLDTFFLHLPIQSVCSEGCKGLCPICGANLNETQCACVPASAQAEKAEFPLAALGSLLSDDKEV